MSSLFIALSLICGVSLSSNSDYDNRCSYAVAYFNGDNGVSGTVTINQDGEFVVNLDVSDLDASLCPDKGREFQYHVHEKWTYTDFEDRYGATKCGPDFTGGHFNPYGMPTCTASEKKGFFDCEVGDMAGRVGNVQNVYGQLSSYGRIAADDDCKARLNPEAVFQRAIVFHCSDGSRLFCAPFQLKIISLDYDDDDDDLDERNYANDDVDKYNGYKDNDYDNDNDKYDDDKYDDDSKYQYKGEGRSRYRSDRNRYDNDDSDDSKYGSGSSSSSSSTQQRSNRWQK